MNGLLDLQLKAGIKDLNKFLIMCDNLGINDEKIKVYNFDYLGRVVTFNDVSTMLDFIKYECENMYENKKLEFEIECKYMTIHQYENLPEFGGY